MKRIAFLLMILTLNLAAGAQVGAPYKYRIKCYMTIPQLTPAVNYTIRITAENFTGGAQTVVYNRAGISSATAQVIDTNFYFTTNLRHLYIQVSRPGCSVTADWAIPGNYAIGKKLFPYCGTQPRNTFPNFNCFITETLLMDNPDRTDPANNAYCGDELLNLRNTYCGPSTWVTGTCGTYWQYSVDGISYKNIENQGYSYFSPYSGTVLGKNAKEIFGPDYLNYMNRPIYFRASSTVAYYQENTNTFDSSYYCNRAREGSNELIYYFYPSTPKPATVQAVPPLCSYSTANSLNIQFDRGLITGERFTAFTLFKDDGAGNMVLYDQLANPPAPDASNAFTWSGISPMATGRYYLTVEAELGGKIECDKNYYPFDVVAPPPVDFSVSGTQDVTCFNGNNGSISLAPAGGIGNGDINLYQYSKDNGATWQTSNVLSNLSAGTYTILVRDANNCISANSRQVTITQPPASLSVGIAGFTDPTGAGVNNGSINITVTQGTAPYSFSWSNGSTSQNITGLGGGTYTVTVTDSRGCTAQQSVTLVEPDPIVINFLPGTISCYGATDGSLGSTVTGGVAPYTYRWSTGQTTSSISNIGAGNYTLTVTDQYNNQLTQTYTLAQPALLTVQLTASGTSCFGGSDGSITSTVTGGTLPYSYSWTNGSTADRISGLSTGNYDVAVMDNSGCFASAQATITSPAILAVAGSIISPSSFGGSDGRIDLTLVGGTAPYSCLWSNGQTTQTALNLSAGNYSVTVTDSKGCTTQQSFTVTEPEPLVVNLSVEAAILCFGSAEGRLNALVSGGIAPYRYSWSNGTSSPVAANLTAGTYTVIVTDNNGVQQSQSYTFTQPSALQVRFTTTEVSCGGSQDGSASALVSGGVAPYTYLWSNGATTAQNNNLAGGAYNLQIRDNNGCLLSAGTTVYAPSALALNAQAIAPVCNGDRNGSITLQPSGGRLPYSIVWSTGNSGNSISGLSAGNYSVSLTDSSGCLVQQSFTLADPAALVLEIGPDKTLCVGQSATVDGSIPNGAVYQWESSNGFSATTATVQLTQAGSYYVIATDNKGCTAGDSIVITRSNQVIHAEFLVSTQAYLNETVVLANISNPALDQVTWNIPAQATVIDKNNLYAEIAFRDTGLYVINMNGSRGQCTASMQKSIMVMQRTAVPTINTEHKTLFSQVVLRPNPNNGQFMVDVTATENAEVHYKIISANITHYQRRSSVMKNVRITETFNLPALTPGTYMLLIESPKENKVIKLIIL